MTEQHERRDLPAERLDALRVAREHVEKLATNARGYQDGVSLRDKVNAVERLARFLMGETEDEE